MSYSVGDRVSVINGSYKGKLGTVHSASPKAVRLQISGESKPTGNIPLKNVAFEIDGLEQLSLEVIMYFISRCAINMQMYSRSRTLHRSSQLGKCKFNF